MKKLILSCLLLISVINVFGYNDLKVGDPRSSWWTNQGTIENATMTVQPKGLFMEYGLYLTFSSRGSNWTNAHDSVEVTLNFDLPADAILNDSWLWIGDSIVHAKLMDKWTASSIYESIVKRRRDPSIIMKHSATQYELRVFPMAGNETRKVKITYLMPTTWNKTQVVSQIPTAIVNTSYYKPAVFPIVTWTDATWTNPQIINNQDISFAAKTNTDYGDYQEAIIPASKYSQTVSIAFDSPLENGLYFSPYQQGNEGIYQLALFPDQFFQSDVSKKAAILIDYDATNSKVTSKELLSILKNELLMNLSSKDSFNLMFSNLTITRYSPKWVAASKTNIEAAFSGLNNPLS
ncbi:MAG TPA: VIT domain-containing protein, partial [Prolixibacteraceae bacterium]